MDVIEIGSAQLIFVLDKSDMIKYAIDSAGDSSRMRESFNKIISDLGISRNFSKDVLVQIFESKSGGCEMFVTKLPDSIGLINVADEKDSSYIYLFKSLSDLLECCNMLAARNVTGGHVYAETKSRYYYLMISDDYRYLGEFGAVRCKESVREYLQEHCTLISERAVEQLSALV
ncbi:MAG: adaptor protein MecA [Clostridia bacterium]|nr:adaptor protein MecA [Clostridia bacterium]